MIRTIKIFYLSATILLLVLINFSWATLGGSVLESGVLELGLGKHHFERVLIWSDSKTVENGRAEYGYPFVYSCFGFFNQLEMELNFLYGNVPNNNYPERDYQELIVGTSLRSNILSLKNFKSSFFLGWWEWIFFDKSEYHYHKLGRQFDAGANVGYNYKRDNLDSYIYMGPYFCKHFHEDYPVYFDDELVQIRETGDNWGVLLGIELNFFKHFLLKGELLKSHWFSYSGRIAWMF